MKTKILYLILIITLLLSACSSGIAATNQAVEATAMQITEASTIEAQDQSAASSPKSAAGNAQEQGKPASRLTPPQEAIVACTGKAEQDACEFTAQKGLETGVCETVQAQLACSPNHDPVNGAVQTRENENQQSGDQTEVNVSAYNIEQAISDKAQGMTIAFDALAFMTGNLGAASFFPPGKLADFWGFQYLRDNDPSQMGHSGQFLTSAAQNVLNILTEDQREKLVTLANNQVGKINEYGYKRFVLMDAFQRLLENDLPSGTSGLDEEAIKAYSAELYHLDGEISYERAQSMGNLIYSLDETQKASLDTMVGSGMLDWPSVQEPAELRSLEPSVKVAVMTYAADIFSWYAGSIEADVYFCPERHGTYFGSFYLKDARTMDDPSYAIPTDTTGNMGDALLQSLNPDQAQLITSLVDIQKPSLLGIIDTREQISLELRKFLKGETANRETVLGLMEQYGELDGEIIFNYAVNFSNVYQSLTSDQKTQMLSLREQMLGEMMYPSGAYLFSQPIPMPEIQNSDFLFK